MRRLVIGLVASGAHTLAPAALAQTPSVNEGAPGGPLTQVSIGNDLSCQVQHTGDTSLELFPSSQTPGDCGTFVWAATAGVLFTPDFANHGATATTGLGTRTPFTAVSQTPVSGSGSSASPFRVTTVANLGSTGLQINEVDTYVAGQESYRTDVTVKNTGGSAQDVILYRAGDCFLQNTDSGFGFTGSNQAVGCAANANNSPAGRIEEWVPISGGNNFLEDYFGNVWGAIAAHAPFPNQCVKCTENTDNGAGISWNFSVAAGGQETRSHFTTFSPTGQAGPPPTNTAPPSVTGPRGNPLGLPTVHGCVDRRKFSFKLHHAKGHPVQEADIFINSRLQRVVTGTNIKKLTVKRLPIGRFKLRIVATQDSGAQLISQRKYVGCKKSKPKTHRGHR